MPEHDTFRNDLPLYVSGDLEPDAVERLERHLAGCAECRRTVAEEQAAFDRLRAAGADEGAGEALDGFFDERIAPSLRRRPRWEGFALRAAALLLAFLAGMAVERVVSGPAGEPVAGPVPTPGVPERMRTAQERSNLARTLHALAALRND